MQVSESVEVQRSGLTRRTALRTLFSAAAIGAGGGLLAACSSSGASPASAGGSSSGAASSLDAYKKNGVVMGIAAGMPYSGIAIDGSPTGLGPDVAKAILNGLGITQIKTVQASGYPELVPGLAAKRWDFVGACLTLDKGVCDQALFTDPLAVTSLAFAYLPSFSNPPMSLAAAKKFTNLTLGMVTGDQHIPMAEQVGWSSSKILLFPDRPSAITALRQGRVSLVLAPTVGLETVLQQQPGTFKITPTIPDAGWDASSNAFPLHSTTLYNAYQQGFEKLRSSGQLASLQKKWGIPEPPAKYLNVTAQQVCTLPDFQPPGT
jgi:polar amino acid transport system substrate-binding protein